MSLLRSSLSALFLSTFCFGAEASASPNSVQIESIRFSGTACPGINPSAVTATYDADQQKIILSMKRTEILLQPDVSLSKSRASCVISLMLRPSEGSQIGITSHHFDGVAQMDEGVSTELSIKNFWIGTTRQIQTTVKKSGPSLLVLAASRDLPWEEQIWSLCSPNPQELNINVSMRVFGPRDPSNPRTGSFYTRKTSGPKLGVAFRNCPSSLEQMNPE